MDILAVRHVNFKQKIEALWFRAFLVQVLHMYHEDENFSNHRFQKVTNTQKMMDIAVIDPTTIFYYVH